MAPRRQLDDARQVVRLLAEAATVALSVYYVWILLPPGIRITARAEAHRLVQPFTAARDRRRAINELWASVIHLQTFGVDYRLLREAPER